jgi:hypothetical protein
LISKFKKGRATIEGRRDREIFSDVLIDEASRFGRAWARPREEGAYTDQGKIIRQFAGRAKNSVHVRVAVHRLDEVVKSLMTVYAP